MLRFATLPTPCSIFLLKRAVGLMATTKLIFVTLFAFGCTVQAPAEPEPEPTTSTWCQANAPHLLDGTWSRAFTHRGNQLESKLTLVDQGECSLAFRGQTTMLDEGRQSRMFESQGVIIVTDVEMTGQIIHMDIECQRTYQAALDADSLWTETREVVVYETSRIKLWGDQLVIWDQQYERVLPP